MTEPRTWPGAQLRRDYIVENDDPAFWTLTSASYDACGPPSDSETGQELHVGCEVTLDLDEMSVAGVRVVVDSPLTEEEERCAVGEASWPLLRVPCGIVLIGEATRGRASLDVDTRGREALQVSWHDRAAIVPVAPGDYRLRVLQYLNGRMGCGGTEGPAYLIQFTRWPERAGKIRLPERQYFTIRPGVPADIANHLRTTEPWKQHASLNPLAVLKECPQDPAWLPRWIEPLTDCTWSRNPMPDYSQPL